MKDTLETRSWFAKISTLGAAVAWILAVVGCAGDGASLEAADSSRLANTDLVVIAFNELGMHCMNQDFADLCILPPFNTLRTQVIRRGDNPEVIRTGAQVSFTIPGNTISSTKTNFWQYAAALFGMSLPADTGLTGTRLSGAMPSTANGYYEAVGIPVTPIMDNGQLNAYPLATVTASFDGMIRSTQAVVPVSWEISCNLCHGATVESVASRAPSKPINVTPVSTSLDILADHDRLHGTHLVNQRPVLCAKCHADPALGSTGMPGVKTMSAAMHGAHASRMSQARLANECYACHPGIQTDCQRDNHKAKGIFCTNCHGTMTAMGSTTRTPWVDQPKCSNCHNVPGHEYEEPGKLFKDSRGHGRVMCVTCHNSPHAITPAVNAVDNQQTLQYQDHTGPLNTCSICHTKQPQKPFFHTRNNP